MNMNKKVPNECAFSNQFRRSKKRNKKNNSATFDSWYMNNDREEGSHEPSEDEVPRMPGIEYTPMFWRQPQISQPRQQAIHNGQRLFTAMSDPSVCGYSAVPVTYAMEPVSLPPMYHLYQPMIRPNYRPYRGRTRSSVMRMHSGPSCNSDMLGNEYSSLQENGWNQSTPINYQNGDYASLPPTANTDNKDCRQELNSEHRRYSDPGLGPADLPINSKSDESDSSHSNSSMTTVGKSNKLFLTLVDQMTKMKETNSQLFKELHHTKSDLETVKSELHQLKQAFPSDYQPGMLSDVIREIKEASNMKEEAMFSKLKLSLEKQQAERFLDLERLKSQLEQERREKEEAKERIAKLEKEVATLRLGLSNYYSGSGRSSSNSSSSDNHREIAAFEEENLALRRELQEARTAMAANEMLAPTVASMNLPSLPTTLTMTTAQLPIPATATTTTTAAATTTTTAAPSSTTTKCVSVNAAALDIGTLRTLSPLNFESVYASTPEPISTDYPLSSLSSTSPSPPSPVASTPPPLPLLPPPSSQSPTEQPPGALCYNSEELPEHGGLTSRVLRAPSRATYTTAYI